MKKIILIVFVLCLAVGVYAQKDLKFTAELEKDSIGSEEYVKIVFTIENGSANGFVPPEFEDFDEVYGPNTSTEMSFYNGELTQSATFTYTLRPKGKGTFVIEPAKLEANDQVYTTEHIKVVVMQEPTTPKRYEKPKENKKPAKPKTKKKRKIYKI